MNQHKPLAALEIRGLQKNFDRPAVDGLDLVVRAGEFYSLLGPNGAGKTTTLRMVAGLLRPDAGTIEIAGIDALADPVSAKQIMAWVSDEPMIYDKLTPFEYLEFVAGLWRIEPGVAEARANELIGWLGLGPHAHERCEGFSKGMRQKVALAGALVHDPRLIILDEPLTGLDAGSARQVKTVLRERVAAGGTVIMTTHILEVAERMADRIGVIAGGRLIAEGTLDELRRRAGKGDTSLEDTFLALVAEAGGSGVTGTASLAWFAHHEFRLAWRDWLSMLTAGKRRRARVVALAFLAFAVFMHFVAYSVVAQFAEIEVDADRGTLVVITGCALLAWSLMMSQAMESVTRAFYARSDLDLILSSPVIAQRVFAVRIATIAASTMLMAVLIAAPFINVLVWRGGARWLAAYGVVLAVGAIAAAMSVALTVALFRTIGPRRTRLAAQIVAAVIGAIFVIGLQMAAIVSYGTISQIAFLKSETLVAIVPAIESLAWWPARAILGDTQALLAVLAAAFTMLGASIVIFSARFGEHAIAAAGVSEGRTGQRGRYARVPHGLAEADAAAQGMDAADPRSLARVADADAASLSAASRADAVAGVRPGCRRPGAAGAGPGDGGGPAGRRPRLAGDLRRGRARPGAHRAGAGALDRARQVRSGGGRRRRDLRAVHHRGGDRLAARRHRVRGRHCRRGAVLDPDPALVPHPGAAQALPPPPDIVARRDLRGGILLDRLGGDRRPRRVGQMAGRDHGGDRARHSRRCARDQSSQGRLGLLKDRPARRVSGRVQQIGAGERRGVRADRSSRAIWSVIFAENRCPLFGITL